MSKFLRQLRADPGLLAGRPLRKLQLVALLDLPQDLRPAYPSLQAGGVVGELVVDLCVIVLLFKCVVSLGFSLFRLNSRERVARPSVHCGGLATCPEREGNPQLSVPRNC